MKKIEKLLGVVILVMGLTACSTPGAVINYENGHFGLTGTGKIKHIEQCQTKPLADGKRNADDLSLGECERLLDGHKEIAREAVILIKSTGSNCWTFYNKFTGSVKTICW